MNSLMPCCAMMMSWKGAGLPSSCTWFLPGTGAWVVPWTCTALMNTFSRSRLSSLLSLRGTNWFSLKYLLCPFTRCLKCCLKKSHVCL
uniref:Alternative protein OGFOD1 n=1 Tax=Homo sapiens TaxID=9606 RepID=L8ECH8_HUMAN|nr:alternative protein OGFOD1 [Homo sapiens]